MKYLIFGDIHGNLPAFELMLRKEKNNYDIAISHGDVVNYGPWSNECVDLLGSLEHVISLKGNHEIYFIESKYDGKHPVAKAFFNFNIDSFTRKRDIETYKEQFILKNFIVTHTINNQYIYKDTTIKIKNDYIIGHSHQQFQKKVNGNKIINTGSVGQNREFINVINYILFDDACNKITLRYLIYDPHIIIDEFKTRNYPSICVDYYKNKKLYIP